MSSRSRNKPDASEKAFIHLMNSENEMLLVRTYCIVEDPSETKKITPLEICYRLASKPKPSEKWRVPLDAKLSIFFYQSPRPLTLFL
ncbi:hypothetical protein CVT25_009105 [Psilocybe cyanescens]|uniref:Uncharacterized protein n=1 Tax=Psilocybe cyanescens TaxID=93625 RepID=A0A409VNE6_PSICY|nr:hypothetical protein CVT25_009105 [Psilocybe cyanescens]